MTLQEEGDKPNDERPSAARKKVILLEENIN